MARYILNKKVNSSKANELQDFKGIGDSIWNFLSAVYQANWDLFYMDNKSKSCPSFQQGLFWLLPKTTRNSLNLYLLLSIRFPRCLLSWLNQRRKLISFPNTSRTRNLWPETRIRLETIMSRSLTVDFIFIFSFHFIFFFFFFYFLFLEQLGLGFISHAVTSWWQSHKTDHET